MLYQSVTLFQQLGRPEDCALGLHSLPHHGAELVRGHRPVGMPHFVQIVKGRVADILQQATFLVPNCDF